MSFRRTVWVVLLTALATMAVMWYLQSQAPKPATRPAATKPAGESPTKPAALAATAPAPRAAPTPTTAPAPEPTTAPAPQPAPKATWKTTVVPQREISLGSLDERTGYKMQLDLTSAGAAVEAIRLSEYHETVADTRQHRNDPDAYFAAVGTDPKLKGNYRLLHPIVAGEKKTFPLATERLLIEQGPRTVTLYLSGPRWSAGKVVETDGTQKLTFTCHIWRNDKDFARLEKTYSLAGGKEGSYSVGVDLKLVNLTGEKLKLSLVQLGPAGVPRENLRDDRRSTAYGRQVGKEVKVFKADLNKAEKMDLGLAKALAEPLGHSDGAEPILWIGQINKFFAVLAYIVPEDDKALHASKANAAFFNAAVDASPGPRTLLPGVMLGPYEIDAGATRAVTLDVSPDRRSATCSTRTRATMPWPTPRRWTSAAASGVSAPSAGLPCV